MTPAIHPGVRIGHVHLTVSNLERSLKFYRGALGFEVTQRCARSAVFLSAGGYHHHIGLNTWRLSIRAEENWRARSSGCSITAFRSKGRLTMA